MNCQRNEIVQTSQEYGYLKSYTADVTPPDDSSTLFEFGKDETGEAVELLEDLASYVPPRFSRTGEERNPRKRQDVARTMEASVRPCWTKQSTVNTSMKLREKRMRQFHPDPSYDLDGDGTVGNQDLFIANIFDADRDGKLNRAEKANALEAVQNGIHDEYIFYPTGVKKKTIIDRKNENQGWIDMSDLLHFTRMRKKQGFQARSEFLKSRRDAYMQEAGAYVGQYRAAHRKRIEPRNYLEKADEARKVPLEKRSRKHKQRVQKARAREKAGLNQEIGVPVSPNDAVSYVHIPNPLHGTQTELVEHRKQNNIQEMADAEARTLSAGYEPALKREEMKKEAHFQNALKHRRGMVVRTRTRLKQEKKNAERELCQALIARGQAIRRANDIMPAFAGSEEVFSDLQHRSRECVRPHTVSNFSYRLMKKTGRHYEFEEASYDSFKEVHVLDHENIERRKRVAENINRCPAPEISYVPTVSVHSLAVARGIPSVELTFTPRFHGREGTNDNSAKDLVEPRDVEALYSSFTKDNVFRGGLNFNREKMKKERKKSAAKPVRLYQSREELRKNTPSTYSSVPKHANLDMLRPLTAPLPHTKFTKLYSSSSMMKTLSKSGSRVRLMKHSPSVDAIRSSGFQKAPPNRPHTAKPSRKTISSKA